MLLRNLVILTERYETQYEYLFGSRSLTAFEKQLRIQLLAGSRTQLERGSHWGLKDMKCGVFRGFYSVAFTDRVENCARR